MRSSRREPAGLLLKGPRKLLVVASLPFLLVLFWCAVATSQEPEFELQVEELPTSEATSAATPGVTTGPAREGVASGTVTITGAPARTTPTSVASPAATPTEASTATPVPVPPVARPTPAPTPRGPRIVVLMLGGVSWLDWITLGSSTNTSTPGFRRVLEEGALAAARLPGTDTPGEGRVPSASGISPAMLRAAAALSTGSYFESSRTIPPAAALTLGPREQLGASAPSHEPGPAALIYARRTGKIKDSSALLNLGWGELRNHPAHSAETFPFGALGHAVQLAGGKTIALGSADTFVAPEVVVPTRAAARRALATRETPHRGVALREWALMAADGDGAVATGDVTAHLLARDRAMPFGLRTNLRAVMQVFDRATAGEDLSLVAVEWGDTRRAFRYEPWCTPEIARAHRWAALARADAFLQALIGGQRLNAPNDRLVIIAVPDLDTPDAQWLPMAFWRPLRGSQGALLHAPGIGEQPGVLPLESMHGMLLSRLPLAALDGPVDVVSPQEIGTPSPSAKRLRRLLALQAGTNWLDDARRPLHLVWATLLILALGFSLLALSSFAGAGERLRLPSPIPAAGWARAAWVGAMTIPLLLWLFGICVETTWRFGALSDGGGEAQPSWKLVASLLGVALLALWMIGAARGWFQRVRLQGVRIGTILLLLTFLGLWIGGFALPWNALLGESLLRMKAVAVRLGDVWALLLISATLAGVASLTSRRAARQPVDESAGAYHNPIVTEAGLDSDDAAIFRRVINLRPALIWMAVTALIILWWGRNPSAAVVALLAFGVMALRLSFERAPRATRVRWRRVVVAVAVLVLLLWQRGATPTFEQSLAAWWPRWLEQWGYWWWTLAFLATVAGAVSFLTLARGVLRGYLHSRYAMRAGLTAATVAALASLIIYGPMGPPLIGLYTLGAVMYEVLGIGSATGEA